MKPAVNLYKLGRLPYVRALNVQQILFDKLKEHVTSSNSYGFNNNQNFISHHHYTHTNRGIGNSLILVEHEPVYTIGIRSKQYNDKYLLQLKTELREHKLRADFVKTNRGGLITFHGPGQLVAYPIIYLGDFTKTIQNRSVKAYVNVLEATIIDTLAKVGLDGAHTVREYPGVWLAGGERKIAFIGISCKRFVTMHGISINCDCDLSWFDHIVSCGIEDKLVTSIRQELLAKYEQTKDDHQLAAEDCVQTSDDVYVEGSSNCLLQAGRVLENSGDRYQNKCPESDVERISEAFCLSFSQHFDCNLIESSDSQVAGMFKKVQ